MRKILIFYLFFSIQTFGQFEKLKGNWISNKNEMLSIQDSINSNNYLTNNELQERGLYLEINNDTISLQERYYLSSDNYKKMYVNRYDLKIIKHTDSLLAIEPVSKLSKNLFKNKKQLTFINQKYITNPKFKLEKLVFRTSACYGSCPILNLNLNSDRKIELEATYFDKNGIYGIEEKSGSFTGEIDEQTYNELLELLIQAKIDLFNIIPNDFELCCDGAIKTIITYHNGKRNYVKSMHTPRILEELIKFLYLLPEKARLERTNKKFKFEE